MLQSRDGEQRTRSPPSNRDRRQWSGRDLRLTIGQQLRSQDDLPAVGLVDFNRLAIPGVFPLVPSDEDLLVDVGYRQPLPPGTMRRLYHNGTIIGVDLGPITGS
ncbi:MAG: hypothetical protein ACRDWH_05655 [Acidimicrobiia bacterium]